MKSKYSSIFLPTIFTTALATTGIASAGDLFWNSTVAGDWNTTTGVNWAPSSGLAPTTAFVGGEAAIFDQSATYTVTVTEDQTAASVLVSAGDVALAGANKISSSAVTISSGAKLTAAPANYLKAGTTALTVNGTLDNTVNAGTGVFTTLAGSGSLLLTGTLRVVGPTDFSGNITGPVGISTENSGTAAIAFSGTNDYSGNFLMRYNKNIRLGSIGALSPNSFLSLGTGVFELAGTDFSRFVTGSGAGNVRIGVASDMGGGTGNVGFAAINADRAVELKNTVPGSIIWGSASFFPTGNTGSLVLGTNASTHKITLISGLDLGEATRSFVTDDGAAVVEGEISGVLSGTTALSGIKKIGAGVLILSGDNTFTGPVEMNSSSGVNTGWLRVAHSNALGPDAPGKVISLTSSTSNAKGGIQLVGGVSVNGKGIDIGGRNNGNTFLENVSGNNSWSGTLRISGPGGSYFMESKADTLTLSGNLFNNVANSTRTFTLLGAGNFLLSGAVRNNSATLITGLVQSGAGTTTLAGTNHTYSGPTNITAGRIALAAGATLANSSPIDVSGGIFDVSAIVGGWTLGATQTLSGTSNVVGAISADGTVSPATAAVGNLSFSSSLTLNAPSTYALSIAADGLSNDKLLVTGALAVNGSINVSLNGSVPVAGNTFDVADAPTITGTPTITGDALPDGLVWDTSSFTTNGTIKVVAGGAGPYATWATSKGLTGANNGSSQDPDFDTVSNLVEFVVGGQPNPANPGSNSTGLLPVATTPGSDFVFTFTRDPQSNVPELSLKIEVGTDLVTFPDVYTVGVSPEITVTGTTVKLTIPRSPDTKKFARLNAVYTAP